MKPVKSSNISAYGYDADKRELKIMYLQGGTYVYHDVSPEAFAALESAASVGSHVAKHIKSKHRFSKSEAK